MTINVDCPPVKDEEEALSLILYHLRMAAMYFEATPEKFPHDIYDGEFSADAMFEWQIRMEQLYLEGD